MRLYHFTTEQYGLEAIRRSRLKIARINELNDPFEFIALQLDKEGRKAFRSLKNSLSKNTGVVCLSLSWRHPLMLSHYADKHNGVCLGFEVTEDKYFRKVEYRSQRPTLNEFGHESLRDFNSSSMKRLLFMKYEAWSYEAEFRAFCRLEDKDPISDLYFSPFDEDLKLVEVIVGERSSISRRELDSALGEPAHAVNRFKARSAFKEFEVVRNKNDEAWI
jgi:hypothetical protein